MRDPGFPRLADESVRLPSLGLFHRRHDIFGHPRVYPNLDATNEAHHSVDDENIFFSHGRLCHSVQGVVVVRGILAGHADGRFRVRGAEAGLRVAFRRRSMGDRDRDGGAGGICISDRGDGENGTHDRRETFFDPHLGVAVCDHFGTADVRGNVKDVHSEAR